MNFLSLLYIVVILTQNEFRLQLGVLKTSLHVPFSIDSLSHGQSKCDWFVMILMLDDFSTVFNVIDVVCIVDGNFHKSLFCLRHMAMRILL